MAASRRPVAEQESYFVSMTDLMIGLLFVFIIMLMSFAITYREAEQEQQTRAQDLEATNERLTDNSRSLRHILETAQRSLRARGIEVRIDPDKGVLRLPEDILFDSARAELTPAGQQAVAALADALSALLPCFAELSLLDRFTMAPAPCVPGYHGRLEGLLVEGHTDDRPLLGGRYRDNWELSAARAISTYDALQTRVPALGRMANDRGERLFGVSGYGEHRPVADNRSEAGRQANRRIDLRFLMAAPEAAGGRP
jgi:flagellar motor protein MotB